MRRPAAWTLRTRLVLVVAIVAIVAIMVVDVATFSSLRGSLLTRVDRQVTQTLETVAPPRPGSPGTREAPALPSDGTRPGPNRPPTTPAGTWMAVYRAPDAAGAYGEPVAEVVAGRDAASVVAADRPRITPTAANVAELLQGPRTIDGSGSGADAVPRFRLAAKRLGGSDVFLVAVPLTDIDATLARLLRIEWIVGAIAALGVVLLALVTVRAGLRPLESIARAADEVAFAESGGSDGELTRRVPSPTGAGTEVGRLAAALNGMLGRIDESFAAQHATQRQLRQFIADASHELRTPLTSIRGFAELARTRGDEMSGSERAAALQRVEDEADHLGRLVEDLLLLSRLEEGLPLHAEQVDVASVVASAVDAARVIEPARAVHFESSGAVQMRADRVRVRQLVDNLLANVRAHAGDDAEVTVSVAPTRESGGGDGVLIEVRDTGVGLAAADMAAATDRFWRADAARARQTGGSGLGLSIVSAIAEAHGGEVELEAGAGGRGLVVGVRLAPLP